MKLLLFDSTAIVRRICFYLTDVNIYVFIILLPVRVYLHFCIFYASVFFAKERYHFITSTTLCIRATQMSLQCELFIALMTFTFSKTITVC